MSDHERRRFQRIEFDVDTQLSQEELNWRAELKDISLKGVLVSGPLPPAADASAPIAVQILLSDQAVIQMQTSVAHQNEGDLGLICQSLDVESMRHLRRLIELNLGDPAEAERELHELIN